MKVRILHILTTFTQVTARLKHFIVGWLLVLGLKEGLVECATVCVKSWVILLHLFKWTGTLWIGSLWIMHIPILSYLATYYISAYNYNFKVFLWKTQTWPLTKARIIPLLLWLEICPKTRDSNEWDAKAQDVSWFVLQIHPMIFVGVQKCKVLLYIGGM